MRLIERTSRFKRDYKRESKRRHRKSLNSEFIAVSQLLVEDGPLPDRHRDHALTGQWSDHRDCYIKPDLVLIYRKVEDHTLQLVRLGSHSELGL